MRLKDCFKYALRQVRFHTAAEVPYIRQVATLRELRLAAEMTQREVAEAVGVSQVQVSRWEAEGGPKPQPGNRRRLARLFKVAKIDWS